MVDWMCAVDRPSWPPADFFIPALDVVALIKVGIQDSLLEPALVGSV